MISVALYAGLRQRKNLLYWRRIKLASSLFAAVGLMLFLLNFEKTVRDAIGAKSKEYLYAEFIDLKFYITSQVDGACAHEKDSHQAALTCFDLRNIDRQLIRPDLPDAK